MKNAYVLRGLPGSGKTALARTLLGCWEVVAFQHNVDKMGIASADNFFTNDQGDYRFVGAKLQEAHEHSFYHWSEMIDNGWDKIAVANTFSCKWEYQRYVDTAKFHGYRVTVIDLFDQGMSDLELSKRNLHNVPVNAIAAMRKRWEK